MSKNNNYTPGNLLDYEYFSKNYELENPDFKQQINIIDKLENNEATMFFIIENQKKQLLIFHNIL